MKKNKVRNLLIWDMGYIQNKNPRIIHDLILAEPAKD